MKSKEKKEEKSKEVCINLHQQSVKDTMDKTLGNNPKKAELAFQNQATMKTLAFAIGAIALGCALGNALLNELNLPHIKKIDHSKAKVPSPQSIGI